MTIRSISGICFVLAMLLLSANVVGVFTSLRNEEIFVEKNTLFPSDITLNINQVHDVLNGPSTDRKSYVKAVNQAINKGIAHYLWLDEGIEKYNLRIPFHENYLLFLASFVLPEYYRKYEFRDYRRAIERGVGLCSQHAIVVAEILEEKGISSAILSLPDHVSLPGHVVAAARVDDERDEWWVLDADYGVVIPHGPEQIGNKPDIIVPYYTSRGYDEATVAMLTANYGKKGRIFPEGAKNYGWKTYWTEGAAYVLIWVIPGLLMIPLMVTTSTRPQRAGALRVAAGEPGARHSMS